MPRNQVLGSGWPAVDARHMRVGSREERQWCAGGSKLGSREPSEGQHE
jgi:hypothetical protein